jgi:PilZ domain
MKERRKVKRRYLLYYVRVYDAETKEQIGNLVDITSHGAMILSPSPINEGKVFDILVELSEDVAKKAHMELSVRSIWCHPDIDPSLHNIGLVIEKISPDDIKTIRRIIEIYGFRDNKPPR